MTLRLTLGGASDASVPPVVRGMAAGGGRRLIHSTASRGGALDRVIFETAQGPEAWHANLSEPPLAIVVKGGPGTRLHRQTLDLASRAPAREGAAEWPAYEQGADEPIALGAYAVARVFGWH